MKRILIAAMAGLFSFCACASSFYRMECVQSSPSVCWRTEKGDWASGGSFVMAYPNYTSLETDPYDFHLDGAGVYQLAVRYLAVKDSRTNFALIIRNGCQEIIHVEYIDWCRKLPVARPYQEVMGAEAGGPAWHRFQFAAECAGDYRVSVIPLCYGKLGSHRKVDCFLVGRNLPEHLERMTAAQLAAVPAAPAPRGKFTLPSLNAYIGNPARPYIIGLINNGTLSPDAADQIYLGMSREHGTGCMDFSDKPTFSQKVYGHSGIKTQIEVFNQYRPDLDKRFPSPTGRYVNADGEVGSTYSFSFRPYWDEIDREAAREIRRLVKAGQVDQISFSLEWGGAFDYSQVSQQHFRKYLRKKYRTLQKLNSVWKIKAKNWEDIHPPKKLADNPSAYYDFQNFSGRVFAEMLGRRVDMIEKTAPGLQPTTQLSNLNIFTAFKAMRPMDYEQIVRLAFRNRGALGWDSYCTDDYMGAEIDYLDSVAGGLPLINQETNVHSEDSDLLVRTFWTNIGKGVKGVYLFMCQEGVIHDSYPKWGCHNPDFSHKDKLGAVSDAIHEIHRFEPLLAEARRQPAVKPILVYYSQLDALYMKPLLSAWAEAPNSPYRVYELLRGLGYPVRYVTPLQIAEGRLKDGCALVLSQTSVIPAETSLQIQQYIREGGVAIADMMPGVRNEHHEMDLKLMQMFGVEPVRVKIPVKSSSLALQESIQGYGEMTINAIENKDIPSSVFEIYQQTDSAHPVLQGLAPFTMSGMGLQKISCIAGDVIGMVFGGQPGLVVNAPGKGRTLYLAGMLGSVFGGGCSVYEFDDAHAGAAPSRLLRNFLTWAGAVPYSRAVLEPKIARKVRIEDPLVDGRGNVLISLTSFNDGRLPDFPVELMWPESIPMPGHFYAFTDRGRNLVRVVPEVLTGGRIRFRMPGFVNYAALVAMTEFSPVISIVCEEQKAGRMISGTPGETLSFRASVHGMSGRPLQAGVVELTLPLGWKSSVTAVKIPEIPAWGRYDFKFQVTLPKYRSIRRVRPVTLHFRNREVVSTPSSAVVWFD